MGHLLTKTSNSIEHEDDDTNSIIKITKKEYRTLVNNIHYQEGLILKLGTDCLDGVYSKIEEVKDSMGYEYIVFSGGGTKGSSFCGALQKLKEEFEKKGKKIYDGKFLLNGVCGTSAGSILASLLIWYEPDELIKILKKCDLNRIVTDNQYKITGYKNLYKKFGECQGNYFLEFIGGLIEKKTGNIDYTINQLYKDTGITLVIVGTNINRKKSVYFHPLHPHASYRNIPIRLAIRISMSIPLLLEPVLYDGDYFVDGGILDNYPIHVFDGDYPGQMDARLNMVKPNPKVLGINITTVDESFDYKTVKRSNIKTWKDYIGALVETSLIDSVRRIITPVNRLRTVVISTPNYSVTDFNLTEEQIDGLIADGYKAMENFLDKN